MKVTYLSFGQIYTEPGGRLTSDTASTRYRVLLPAEYLAGKGHQVQVVSTNEAFWRDGSYTKIAGDAVVFGKSFDGRNEQLAAALRRAARRVHFDICDNHFDHPQFGGHFRRMIDLADAVVASTLAMAEIVRSSCGRESCLIGDPVENTQGTARFEPATPGARLLWFGHPVNLDTLLAVVADLQRAARQHPLELTVVSAAVPGLADEVERWNRAAGTGFRARFVSWSKAELGRQLAECDTVIIPSSASSTKGVKSPNRLTESIWAGRLAIAYPVPSYMEFAAYAEIATDIAASLLAALDTPAGYTARIAAGQDYVAKHYSTRAIGDRWEELFRRDGLP